MKRSQHCKGCTLFHNAGHPKGSKNEKYNSWCLAVGKSADKSIGVCKNKGLKNGAKL